MAEEYHQGVLGFLVWLQKGCVHGTLTAGYTKSLRELGMFPSGLVYPAVSWVIRCFPCGQLLFCFSGGFVGDLVEEFLGVQGGVTGLYFSVCSVGLLFSGFYVVAEHEAEHFFKAQFQAFIVNGYCYFYPAEGVAGHEVG